jgi:hypothetical protein
LDLETTIVEAAVGIIVVTARAPDRMTSGTEANVIVAVAAGIITVAAAGMRSPRGGIGMMTIAIVVAASTPEAVTAAMNVSIGKMAVVSTDSKATAANHRFITRADAGILATVIAHGGMTTTEIASSPVPGKDSAMTTLKHSLDWNLPSRAFLIKKDPGMTLGVQRDRNGGLQPYWTGRGLVAGRITAPPQSLAETLIARMRFRSAYGPFLSNTAFTPFLLTSGASP